MLTNNLLPMQSRGESLLCINVSDQILEFLRESGYQAGARISGFTLPLHQLTPTKANIVLIDAAAGQNKVLASINAIRSRPCLSGGEFRVLCYSTIPRNPRLALEIEKRGARYVRIADPAMLVEWIEFSRAEMAQFAKDGPCFRILHRFSQGTCGPGEEIAKIELVYGGKAFQLHLSLSQRFVFDFLARNRSTALDALQITSGLHGWFYRDHGKNGGTRYTTKVRVPTVKVITQRLRQAMAKCFTEAGLPADPYNVLRTFHAEGSNRALYRLHAHVQWDHQ